MKRRSFLKIGAVGAATTAILPASTGKAASTGTNFTLFIAAAPHVMIDGTEVPSLAYFLDQETPRPEIRVREGDEITINVVNWDTRPHGFHVRGIPASRISQIEPGETATIVFTAPEGGSFLYLDPYMAPLNRVLGLYGAFIVEPINGLTDKGWPTPFSRGKMTQQVQDLFDAMGGGHPRFPGKKWDPNDPDREKLWLFSQIDPSLNARVAAGEFVNPDSVIGNFLPRYFLINGVSGFDTALHDDHLGADHPARRIMPRGKQGEPCLIRTMNAGLATHSVHIHGNHCLELSEEDNEGTNFCETHCYSRDVWLLKPQNCIDVLLPFERPPDIPFGKWPPSEEPWPLRYVMHCHFEISQTAAGGNYPQGAVTHWEMTGAITRDL